MKKRIAVIVANRQDEAIRMSIGLTLADDEVDLFFINELHSDTKEVQLNISTGKELGISMYSICEHNKIFEEISPHQLSKYLLEYDHILPY